MGNETDSNPTKNSWKSILRQAVMAVAAITIAVLASNTEKISRIITTATHSTPTADTSAAPGDSTIPTDVKYDSVISEAEAKENSRALNGSGADCMYRLNELEWESFTPPIYIRAIICRNGNVLYQLSDMPSNEERAIYRGVTAAWFRKKFQENIGDVSGHSTQTSSYSRISENGELIKAQYGQMAILCQRPLPDGRGLFQRIHAPTGQCFDRIIDTWSGRIVSMVQAPCQPC